MTVRRLIACAAALLLASCTTVPQPGNLVHDVVQGHVAVPVASGSADALLFVPQGRGRHRVMLIWPDGGGLRPAHAALGRRLAEQGWLVLLPNSFYRSIALDGSAAAPALPADQARARGAAWRDTLTEQAAMADARAYLAFLDAQPMADTARPAATVGLDYGSAHAFHAARAVPGRIGAVVALYPSGTATPRPNSPHLFVRESRARYLVLLARNDDVREPGDKDDYRKAFEDAGRAGTVDVLAADHGFAMADDTAFDAAAAEAAWQRITAFLAQ